VQVSGNKDYYEFAFATLSVLPGGDVQVTVEVIGNFDLLAEDKFGVKLYPEKDITCDGGCLDTIFKNFFSCDLAILERNFSQPNARGLLDRCNSLWTYPRARRCVLELYLSHVMQQIRSGGEQTTTQYWNGYTALHLAAAVGDIPSAQELLKCDPSLLNARTEGEDTILFVDKGKWDPGKFYSTQKGLMPLHVAVINGHLDMVRYLLDQKANTEIITGEDVHLDGGLFGNRMTALHLAIHYNRRDIVWELMRRCPQLLDIPDEMDSLPYWYARLMWNKEDEKTFLEQALKQSSLKTGIAALEDSLMHDDPGLASFVLSKMTAQQVTAVDEEGKTILHKIVEALSEKTDDSSQSGGCVAKIMGIVCDRSEIVGLLEKRDKKGLTPLLFTLSHEGNTFGFVQMLLDRGSSPVAKTKENQTALHLISLYKKDPGRYMALFGNFSYKIDVNARDNKGDTALHCAASRGNLQAIQELLKWKKIDVNLQNKAGETALSLAVQENGWKTSGMILECVRELLRFRGIKANIPDTKDRTPLHYAAQDVDADAALLKIPGLDVNAQDNESRTALHCAAEKGSVLVIQALARAQEINGNIQDKQGRTPLHYAALGKDPDCVEALLRLMRSKGIDVQQKDGKGCTALDLAVYNWRVGNIRLLGIAAMGMEQGKEETKREIKAHIERIRSFSVRQTWVSREQIEETISTLQKLIGETK
jgi:ankyrin repeat protein